MKLPPVDGKARFTRQAAGYPRNRSQRAQEKFFTKERRQSSAEMSAKARSSDSGNCQRPPFKIKFPVRRGKGSISWLLPPLYIRPHPNSSKRNRNDFFLK